MLSIVVAMDENGLIGADNGLPWHLPADLKHFKALTMGHPILMGRRTHESIGRPLPGRQNLVLTRRAGYRADGCTVVNSLKQAYETAHGQELMVIGGAKVYEAVLPAARRIYLTRVHHRFEGDTFFPQTDWEAWREIDREPHAADGKNAWPYSFVSFVRAV
ncbi:MAG: dihydrofolate reductase [Gammaproteobacteria bacterium]